MTILERGARDNGSASFGRAAVWVAVLALHFGMLLLFTHVRPRTRPSGDADTTSSVIMLRFIAAASQPSRESAQPEVTATTTIVKTRTHTRNKRAPTASAITTSPTATPAIAPARESTNTIYWSLPNPTQTSADSFADRLDAARDQPAVTHLPGSSAAVVKGLRMTDPRNQGIAGAVRTVQSILGVVNSHCADVAVWSTFSTQELLDRHISPSQVDRTAEEYGCRER